MTRLRIWLLISDVAERLHMPRIVQSWAIQRAAMAVPYDKEDLDPDPDRRPW